MKGKLAVVAPLAGGAAGAYGLLRRPKPLRTHYSRALRKVLIVGGGFGSMAVLDRLVEAIRGDSEVGSRSFTKKTGSSKASARVARNSRVSLRGGLRFLIPCRRFRGRAYGPNRIRAFGDGGMDANLAAAEAHPERHEEAAQDQGPKGPPVQSPGPS
jgi:hypothetical protein